MCIASAFRNDDRQFRKLRINIFVGLPGYDANKIVQFKQCYTETYTPEAVEDKGCAGKLSDPILRKNGVHYRT